MKSHNYLFILYFILIFVLASCNLPDSLPSEADDLIATITAQALTNSAPPAEPSTPPAEPSAPPPPTEAPGATTEPTPTNPIVSVSSYTNCRTGPGVAYDKNGDMDIGETAEVVGKNSSTGYWIINKPGGPGTCWLWGQYATVLGNIDKLPEYPIPALPPTATPTDTVVPPTATPIDTVVPPVTGDLHIIDIFLKTNFEVAVRVGTDPIGSLNGNYQYTVYSNGALVQQGSCTVPVGSYLCSTGHIVSGTETIQVVIDSANAIAETNEGNNSSTVSCVKATLDCN